jgi:hypothetical protein
MSREYGWHTGQARRKASHQTGLGRVGVDDGRAQPPDQPVGVPGGLCITERMQRVIQGRQDVCVHPYGPRCFRERPLGAGGQVLLSPPLTGAQERKHVGLGAAKVRARDEVCGR